MTLLSDDITGYLIGGGAILLFVVVMALIFRAINRSMMKKLAAFAARHGLEGPHTKSFGREPRCHGEVNGRRVEYHAYDAGETVGASSDTGPGEVIKHTALSVSLARGPAGKIVFAGRYTLGEMRRAKAGWPTQEVAIPHAKLGVLTKCYAANEQDAARLLADSALCEKIALLHAKADYVEIEPGCVRTVMNGIIVDEPVLTEQLGLLMDVASGMERPA